MRSREIEVEVSRCKHVERVTAEAIFIRPSGVCGQQGVEVGSFLVVLAPPTLSSDSAESDFGGGTGFAPDPFFLKFAVAGFLSEWTC